MAYTKQQWEKAKGYYEAGLSLSKIKDKTNIARNTISQRAKREQWEHGKNTDYIEAKEIIAVKKGTEKEQSIICADEVADDKIRRANLVYGASEKIVKKAVDIIDDGKVEDKINVGDGMQKFEDRKLNTSDIKNLSDAVDKASLTLGVNKRHSNQDINVNTQNNNLTSIELNKEIVSQTLENFENEY